MTLTMKELSISIPSISNTSNQVGETTNPTNVILGLVKTMENMLKDMEAGVEKNIQQDEGNYPKEAIETIRVNLSKMKELLTQPEPIEEKTQVSSSSYLEEISKD